MTLADIAFEVTDARPGGWVTLKHAKLQKHVRMHMPPEKPPWLASIMADAGDEGAMFRIERSGRYKYRQGRTASRTCPCYTACYTAMATFAATALSPARRCLAPTLAPALPRQHPAL